MISIRLRKTSCVMRNRGWRQRKRSWSSSWRPWILLIQAFTQLHLWCQQLLLLRKAKLPETRWCRSSVTPELPCGSSCLLLQSILLRIMSFVHQSLNWHKTSTPKKVINWFASRFRWKEKAPHLFCSPLSLGFLGLLLAFVFISVIVVTVICWSNDTAL